MEKEKAEMIEARDAFTRELLNLRNIIAQKDADRREEIAELRKERDYWVRKASVGWEALGDLEKIYFDYDRKNYDLVEIRAIISTALREIRGSK